MIPFITRFLDPDEMAWPDIEVAHVTHKPVEVVVIPQGMESGQPSVAIKIETEAGEHIVCETTARLFCLAARIIIARYPKLFED